MSQRAPERQHVISQVLLRRFVDPTTGLLAAYDLIEGSQRLLRPQAVGVVRRYIRRDAAAAETLWQQTERRLPELFAAVENETIFEKLDLLEVLRNGIAVHWARSKTLLAVFNKSWGRVRGRRRETLLRDKEQLTTAFRDRFGLEPAGPEALESVADLIYEGVEERILEEDFFSERVIDNYDRAQALVRQQEIQIGIPEEGEFLIGDAPVVAWKAGHAGLGPMGGVPWDEADAIFFPLGPRHVAALGSPSGWVRVPHSAVHRLNADQVRHAFRHVCYRPNGPLEEFAVMTREALLAERARAEQNVVSGDEPTIENWGIRGGHPAGEVELGFRTDIKESKSTSIGPPGENRMSWRAPLRTGGMLS